MSQSTLTPHTAPRDPATLAQLTPYLLRKLAGDIGAFTTNAQQMAWHEMSAGQRANEVMRLLQAWDQQNPGAYQGGAAPQQQAAPSHAPPPQAPPMQQTAIPFTPQIPPQQSAPPQHQMPPQQQYAPPPPVAQQMAPAPPGMNGMPMGMPGMPPGFAVPGIPMGAIPGAPPMVHPGAAGAVQQAAAAPTTGKGSRGGKGSREPVTNGVPSDSPDLGAAVLARLDQVIAQQAAALTAGQAAGQAATAQVTDLQAAVKTLSDRLQIVEQNVGGLVQYGVWTVLMNANLVANKDGCSLVEALGEVIQNSGMFQQLVHQAVSGKG